MAVCAIGAAHQRTPSGFVRVNAYFHSKPQLMKALLRPLTIAFFMATVSLAWGQAASEQPLTSRSTILAELGGSAPQASIGFDYICPTGIPSLKYAFTLAMTHHFGAWDDFLIAPQLNLLYGQSWLIELGGGVTLPLAYLDDWVVIPRLGVRYQRPAGGWMGRLGFTPIFRLSEADVFLPSLGLGLGYTLKNKS